MLCNKNEKYLLKFMADNDSVDCGKINLIKLIFDLGIRIEFKNINPVNQIIDELEFGMNYKM